MLFIVGNYENISFEDFLHLKLSDFLKKFNSIPETEPLYKIIKSRTIQTSKIKDKI